jgi:hypothetical protein
MLPETTTDLYGFHRDQALVGTGLVPVLSEVCSGLETWVINNAVLRKRFVTPAAITKSYGLDGRAAKKRSLLEISKLAGDGGWFIPSAASEDCRLLLYDSPKADSGS